MPLGSTARHTDGDKGLHRERVTYLLAWCASILFWLCLAGFAAVATLAPDGWFSDFAKQVIPAVAAASGTYATLYWILFRRGLSLQQELLDAIATAIPRSAASTSVVDVFSHPREVPWDVLLSKADQVTLAGRYFGSWAGTNAVWLRAFFKKDGRMTVFVPDWTSRPIMEAAAMQLYDSTAEERAVEARNKVLEGPQRILTEVRGAGKSPDCLTVRLVTAHHHLINQTLQHFESPTLNRLVCFGYDNFPHGRDHLAPVFMLDIPRWEHLHEFLTAERAGFGSSSHSRTLTSAEITAIAEGNYVPRWSDDAPS